MLRPSPTMARKAFGSNDDRRLVGMTRPPASRVSEKRTLLLSYTIIKFSAAKAPCAMNRSSLVSLLLELCDPKEELNYTVGFKARLRRSKSFTGDRDRV